MSLHPKSHYSLIRSRLLGLWKPSNFVLLVLITLIVYLEILHGPLPAPLTGALCTESYAVVLPPSTSPSFSKPGSPLLKRSIPRHELESWQTTPILVNGISKRRNPLMPSEELKIDDRLVLETSKRSSAVGEELILDFYCDYADDLVAIHCPIGYRVWFVGPSIFSPAFTSSSQAIGLDGKRIRVTIAERRILDPGSYEVFAWPEHHKCDQWNHGEVPIQYHRLAVHGSPINFEITGQPQSESSIMCGASPGVTVGRWVSKAHIEPSHWSLKSPHWWWLSTHMSPTSRDPRSTFYSYIYVPYACKKPHHTYREWIDILKPTSLLIIGDSVLRDLYCGLVYASLGGTGEDGKGGGSGKMCQWPKDEKDVVFNHTSHKSLAYLLPSGQTAETAFAWVPNGSTDLLSEYLDHNSSSAPSHISFGVSLWLANDPPEIYASKIRPAIELLVKRFPDAKISVRSSASTVQAIECFDRIGGRRNRMEDNNAALFESLREFPTVTFLDVYSLFNDRPDSTSDGRHWASVGYDWSDRPQTGSAEFAVGDEWFLSWLST